MNPKAGNPSIGLPTAAVRHRFAAFPTLGAADWVAALGRVPLLRRVLRSLAHLYREGSVVNIRRGPLAGMKWKRSHRYVNGYWLGIYELDVQRCLIRHLKRGDVFYDVGANAGFFSLLGAKCVGEAGRIYSFEPVPENVSALRANCDANDLTNCVVEVAVADRSGNGVLIQQESLSEARLSDDAATRPGAMTVITTSLDDFASSHHAPDFIKIDVEGGEASALRGCLGLMRSSNPPTFLIELHNEEAGRAVAELLDAQGYSMEPVTSEHASLDERPRHILAYPGEATR